MKPKMSLEAKMNLLVVLMLVCAVCIVTSFQYWLGDILLAALLSTALILPLSIMVLRSYFDSINRVLAALNNGFYNFLDNDFSISIAKTRSDELGELVVLYNRVSEALRDERVHLYQRELLLDTVIQTTPLSLVLTDRSHSIIYSNSAARQLFNAGKNINGFKFSKLLVTKPEQFSRSVNSRLNGLFTITEHDSNETYHLTQNKFLLNGLNHQLYLFKSLTKEINRQEVNTWKKVIRLISHELNNSLAPITSLAHSGQLLCDRQNEESLRRIFKTMEERARYLQKFIEGYATFARLPKPQIESFAIRPYLESLQTITQFKLVGEKSIVDIYCDPAQLQQAVINLLKNSHESGSELDEITLAYKASGAFFELTISDRGKGMNEKTLANALLPFYSTKPDGTGLGLPLCREIIEAHGGKMVISNRMGGGLEIILILPNQQYTE